MYHLKFGILIDPYAWPRYPHLGIIIYNSVSINFKELRQHEKAYHAAMYQENAVVKAIEHLTQLIEASPWSVDFLEARAECHEHRGMYDDAILDLRYFWN